MLSNMIVDTVQRGAVRAAYAWSMRNMWIFYTGISALVLLSSAFIKRHHLRSDHVETKTGIKKRGEVGLIRGAMSHMDRMLQDKSLGDGG